MNPRLVWLVAAIGLAFATAAYAASDAASVIGARTNFVDVASRLDQGGDLYVIANAEGMLQSAMADLADVVNALPAGKETAIASASLPRLGAFLQQQGFYAVKGLGLSVVPRADGLNSVKLYVGRDPKAASSAFWKAWVGAAPRKLTSLDYLPAETVLARAGTSDPRALWGLVRAAIRDVGTTQVATAFDQALAAKAQQFGVSIDALVSSLGAEGVFAVLLSDTERVTLPVGDESASIPAPSLLCVIAVRDSRVHDFVIAQLKHNGLPLLESTVDGVVLQSVDMPLPLPIPCRPTLAMHRGFLLLGSRPEAVQAAIAAAGATNGILATPAFRAAFHGQRLDFNNGLVYVGPRFGGVMGEIEHLAMSASAGAQGGNLAALQRLLRVGQLKSCAMVIYNLRTGVLVAGTSSSGGREIAAGVALAPIGMLAGMAIPSFVKARTQSQVNACRNNLRMLEAAKAQWALEAGASAGDAPNPNGFLRYFKGGRMPVCPQGGTYTLGNIGADPCCTIPKHRLCAPSMGAL